MVGILSVEMHYIKRNGIAVIRFMISPLFNMHLIHTNEGMSTGVLKSTAISRRHCGRKYICVRNYFAK